MYINNVLLKTCSEQSVTVCTEIWEQALIDQKWKTLGCKQWQYNDVRNFQCSNGDVSTHVIFNIPAMSGRYYLVWAETQLFDNLELQNIGGTTVTSINVNHYFHFDRGPLTIINRFQLYITSSHLLKVCTKVTDRYQCILENNFDVEMQQTGTINLYIAVVKQKV